MTIQKVQPPAPKVIDSGGWQFRVYSPFDPRAYWAMRCKLYATPLDSGKAEPREVRFLYPEFAPFMDILVRPSNLSESDIKWTLEVEAAEIDQQNWAEIETENWSERALVSIG